MDRTRDEPDVSGNCISVHGTSFHSAESNVTI